MMVKIALSIVHTKRCGNLKAQNREKVKGQRFHKTNKARFQFGDYLHMISHACRGWEVWILQGLVS